MTIERVLVRRRDGDDGASGPVERGVMAFMSPPRGGTRPSTLMFSPSSTFPRSPLPLFLASPDRRRAAAAERVAPSPGGMIDAPASRVNFASPTGLLKRHALPASSSDLPAPGMQLGGVPRGFGSPKASAFWDSCRKILHHR